MGYCSDVGVCLTFKNQEDFKTFAAKALLEGVKPEVFDMFHHVPDWDGARVVILMTMYGVKWYRNCGFEDVDGVDTLWSLASDDVYVEPEPLVESGRYITIGEDGQIGDEEINSDEDSDCFARDYLEYTSPQLQTSTTDETTARDLIKEQKDVDKI